MSSPNLKPLENPADLTPEHVLFIEEVYGLSVAEISSMSDSQSREILAGIGVDPLAYRVEILQAFIAMGKARGRSAIVEPALDWTPATLARFKVVPFITPGWVRHQGKIEKRDQGQAGVESLSRFLDNCSKPLLPSTLKPAMVGAMIRNGCTPEDLDLAERLFFTPWLTPERLNRLKAEIFRSPSAPAEVSVCFEAPADVHGIGRFLQEACELAPGATCRPADLFQHYKGWATRAGLQPVGKHTFYRGLEAVAPAVKRGRPRGKDGKQGTVMQLIGVRPRGDDRE